MLTAHLLREGRLARATRRGKASITFSSVMWTEIPRRARTGDAPDRTPAHCFAAAGALPIAPGETGRAQRDSERPAGTGTINRQPASQAQKRAVSVTELLDVASTSPKSSPNAALSGARPTPTRGASVLPVMSRFQPLSGACGVRNTRRLTGHELRCCGRTRMG